YEDYMARQNGRGSSRPRVLTRTARPKSPLSVSARNCSLPSLPHVITLFALLLLFGAFAFAQDSDVDNIHVSPRIEPTNVDPAAAIVSQSLRSRIPVVKSKVELVLVPVTVTDP